MEGNIKLIKKIALVGTHSCGKTTVINDVSDRLMLDGYVFGKGIEVTRACPYKLNKDATFLTQWYVLSKQIEMEANLARAYSQMLLDRSVFDVLAYTFRQSKYGMIATEEYLVIKDAVRGWSDWFPYDILIHLEPLEEVEDDGVRDTDKKYQIEIYNIVNMMLANDVPPKTKVIDIKTLDRKKRADKVYKIIKEVFRK